MVNSKDFAFKVNKQTPSNGLRPPAYGTVIDCRPADGKRGKSEKEIKSRQVRLTRVPGPDGMESKKRKREAKDKNLDEDAPASKHARLDTTTSAPAPAEQPPKARKPQRPTPTKFRRGTVLKQNVDLDCWFIILSFSDPAQLLEMRTRVSFCYRYLRDHPTLWKKSRDHYYNGGLPDPPSILTEFQYAHLRHGQGCMSCHRPSTRKTYWAFLRRWCKPCLQSKLMKEHEAITMLKDATEEHYNDLLKCLPVAIFDSWDNYVGVGPGTTHPQKNVYLRQDVQDLLAKYTRERDANPATWHAESRAWMAQKEQIIEDRHNFARKMETWEDTTRLAKTSDFHEKKSARKKYFKEKAAELTPPIQEKELELCASYRRAVVIPKMPNMLSWSQLKPKVEKEAAELRKRCATPEHRRLPDRATLLPDPVALARDRMGHLLPVYAYSQPSSGSSTPNNGHPYNF